MLETGVVKNYCPTSLFLTVVSKIFELGNKNVVNHRNNILISSISFSDFQCDFKSFHSNADVLKVVVDRLTGTFDKSAATRAAAIDILLKASDRV